MMLKAGRLHDRSTAFLFRTQQLALKIQTKQ